MYLLSFIYPSTILSYISSPSSHLIYCMQPAVFAPCLREPEPPALDQFDLDEHFASEKLRLAQLTNKCHDDDDLEYYIKESGDILG